MEVGKDVKTLSVGDEVYARLPEVSRGMKQCQSEDTKTITAGLTGRNLGSWAEYAKCAEHYVARKPASLSFGDAASLPLTAVTAMQAFRKYKGSLSGKTVFVPAGCK